MINLSVASQEYAEAGYDPEDCGKMLGVLRDFALEFWSSQFTIYIYIVLYCIILCYIILYYRVLYLPIVRQADSLGKFVTNGVIKLF